MNTYITGAAIKHLRQTKGLTQAELGNQIGVSAKAVSKWETARGLPDITLIEPLAEALGVSVLELMAGAPVINRNVSSNLLRSQLYVCPVCGNVIHATGDNVVSCCGIVLPALEAEEPDEAHRVIVEKVEDEFFLRVPHEMTKQHYLSFFALATGDRFQLIKLYPEGNAETRIPMRGRGILYLYCNRHGLMKQKLP